MAGWAVAQGDVMGCRNSKVLPEPPGDVHLDLVKKVSRTVLLLVDILLLPQILLLLVLPLLLCALVPVSIDNVNLELQLMITLFVDQSVKYYIIIFNIYNIILIFLRTARSQWVFCF